MEYYRRILHQNFGDDDYFGFSGDREQQEADNDTYVSKMQSILSAAPCIGVPRSPSQLIGNVYLGTSSDAENIPMLKSMGIKYVLNCAGGRPVQMRRLRQMYGPDTGILGYEEVPLDDDDECRLNMYLDRAHGFIDYGRGRLGKVLIFCPGVSRSGAVAISYLVRNGTPLLQATRVVKDKRRNALVNVSFMEQLVEWSRQRGRLDTDVSAVRAPRYGRALDKHRIRTAHLPTFL